MRVKVCNLLLKMEYPKGGSLEAVVDTGYGGFLAVPRDIFDALNFHKMLTRPRKVEVADGRVVESVVAYGTVKLEEAAREVDGPIETMDGLTEVLVGTHLLADFRMTLDYCLRVASIRPCP